MNYKTSGVDVDLADQFVDQLSKLCKLTFTPGVVSDIGHFAALYRIDKKKYRDPILVACTDGVGTKLKIAIEADQHNTVGIDLVAMSINDLLVTGAKPLFFLDYLATANLEPRIHIEVLKGIVEGCRQSECALIGGETAEMPGMYSKGDYDLAGFAVGIIDRHRLLSPQNVKLGDRLLGLPSTGLHSNGYSLVRKVFADRMKYPLSKPIPPMDRSLGQVLLTPTRIYAEEIDIIMHFAGLRSLAHITGEGIPGNLPRSLPAGLGAELIKGSWPIPPIFEAIKREGGIEEAEMFSVFNMGLGMIAVCSPRGIKRIQRQLSSKGFASYDVGEAVQGEGIRFISRKGRSRCAGFACSSPYPKTKIAVFGSGRGSNMGSILEAIDRGDLHAEIVCVISNHSKALILESARERKIATYHISEFQYPDADILSLKILEILKRHQVDLICLAGYMKKIPRAIIREFQNRILNIHPALLPSFGGKGMYGIRVHEAVIKSGAKFSGASIHLATEEYDEGRIINQDVVPVRDNDTPEMLASRVLQVEHRLYWRTIADWILKLRTGELHDNK